MTTDIPSRSAGARTFTSRAQIAVMGIGFVLFLLGLGAALYLSLMGDAIRKQARLNSEIQMASRDLLSAMQDSETSQRGFLLTGDERYLEPYFISRISLQAIYQDLVDKTADSPAQAKRVDELKPLVNSKLAELETTINLTQRGRKDEALAIMRADSGRQLSIAMRERIDAIHHVEADALTAARARIDRYALMLQADIIATIALGIALLLIVANARTRLLRDLAQQNLLLEERVRERTAILEARTKRIETLIQDMSHRIGNALSLVTGFLDLQARASKSEEVKSALSAARQRVFSIASAQRRMRLAMDTDTVDAASFFETLIEDFRHALPDERIMITADIAPVSVSSEDASAFAVILNELLANAIKHAWPSGEHGALAVKFAREGDDHVLRVTDDGQGSNREDSSGGLGKILVESLVQSLQGTLSMAPIKKGSDRPGLLCIVRAPV